MFYICVFCRLLKSDQLYSKFYLANLVHTFQTCYILLQGEFHLASNQDVEIEIEGSILIHFSHCNAKLHVQKNHQKGIFLHLPNEKIDLRHECMNCFFLQFLECSNQDDLLFSYLMWLHEEQCELLVLVN